MKFRTLIRRSLRFHWRSHLGVVLGAAIGSAALIGALVVGDSVKGSLQDKALQHVGRIEVAMDLRDRFVSAGALLPFFRTGELSISNAFVSTKVRQNAALYVLQSDGIVSRADGAARANQVKVFGIHSSKFYDLQGAGSNVVSLECPPKTANINQSLARQLSLHPGDEFILRLRKPAKLSRDAVGSPQADATTSLRLRVHAVVKPDQFGDFSLRPGVWPPLNVFIDRDELNRALDLNTNRDLNSRANLLLGSGFQYQSTSKLVSRVSGLGRAGEWLLKTFMVGGQLKSISGHQTAAILNGQIPQQMVFEAGGLSLLQAGDGAIELRTSRVFLDEPVARATLATQLNCQPILTFLSTLLCAGTNTTPYSMVTAAGVPWTPADLRDDEIVVSQWLADDLHVKPGDEIALSYFLPESGAKLEEATNTFRVRGIVPMEMPWADRTLMPDFPGIEKAESTRDWDAGFPLTYEIRKKDDDYWKQHRGTPKAFITLNAGQRLWGNRFGNLTAIRFPIPTSTASDEFRAALEKKILANLKPEELGLRFEPVREQALKAAEGSQDFGGLFLGFSFFLITAALLLMAMLFQFGLEQRAPEIGTLLALGFTPKQIRKLLLREGVALAFIGGVIGAVGGIYFAKAMLHALTTIWRDAVGATALNFYATGQTLVIGLFASVVVSAITLWLALRKFVKREPRELLAGEVGEAQSKAQSRKSSVIAVASLVAGLALVSWALMTGNTTNAGAFFGAGALVLVAGLSFVSSLLASRTGVAPASNFRGSSANVEGREACPTLGSLALRGCARRRKRSLGTVGMLACGSFLIVSIGVFRVDANRDATERSSGTGGFALIGETTMPVVHDLNSQSGRDFFALSQDDLKGVNIVPFRVREGDEASCLNLNSAQKPRLLGVKPELLTERLAFTFSKLMVGTYTKIHPWSLLSKTSVPDRAPIERDEIPAIGDANSIQWAMKKKVGDTIDYVDERGQPFKVRIVAAVANSILQGQLIIDEAEFVKRFPGESGYRMFLIDAPTNRATEVSATLSRAMQDVGLELTPAPQRLAQFNAVQNTYLGTFQVLGGLGLLLGSVGLGIVVLRNVLERRGELAVLMAVGFRKPRVQRLLLIENGVLLALGLGVGVIAAAVAVLPAVLSPGAQLPVGSLATTLLAILVNGIAWTWVATRFAVRGDLLKALRNE